MALFGGISLKKLGAKMTTKAKGTLLVVDDEVSILNAVKRVFLTEGYEVNTASSGPEGLKILEHNPTDIIISDMRMPVMSGAEFFRITAERWPDTKRILLTGYSDINSAISAINEGRIDYYVSKPWENEEFVTIIKKSLDNKRLKEQNSELNLVLQQQNEELKIFNTQLEDKVKERTDALYRRYNTLQETHTALSQIFLSIQEFNEGIYKGYTSAVVTQATLLAQALKRPDEEIHAIHLAAMLHQIGKKGLPDEIRYKPFTQLTLKEQKVFAQYPILGATYLAAYPALNEVAHIIMHHREYYDGRGYPNGLKGQTIPLGSRILALVVDYNELQYGSLESQKYYAQLALNYLNDHCDHYDPKILPVFIALMHSLKKEHSTFTEEERSLDQLEPGMILSRDLSRNDWVFLEKGSILTAEVIEKIKRLGKVAVYVERVE